MTSLSNNGKLIKRLFLHLKLYSLADVVFGKYVYSTISSTSFHFKLYNMVEFSLNSEEALVSLVSTEKTTMKYHH